MNRRFHWTLLLVALALALAACGGGSPPTGGNNVSPVPDDPKGYIVSGTVRDFLTNVPVPDVEVVFGGAIAITDEFGYWEFTGIEQGGIVEFVSEEHAICPVSFNITGGVRDLNAVAHGLHGGAEGMGGRGTLHDPYVIQNVAQLQAIREDLTAHYVLCRDIDASDAGSLNGGAGFQPIAWPSGPYSEDPVQEDAFNGTLDGKDHKIQNLRIELHNENYVGLFGHVGWQGKVKNLRFVDGLVSGNNSVGGIAGLNEGILTNIYTDASIKGISHVGGIAGENGEREISFSHNAGSVRGESAVGGVVGKNVGTIHMSFNEGDVFGERSVGGIAGSHDGDMIEYVYNTGNVEGKSDVGGIFGVAEAPMMNAFNKGQIDGETNVGGIVGYLASELWNTYNTGDVHGDDEVGGIVGYLSGATVKYTYNRGSVHGDGSAVGGVVGYGYDPSDSPKVNNAYFDTDVQNRDSVRKSNTLSDANLGKTTDELKRNSTYMNWEPYFWIFVDGRYPELRNMP